MSDMVRNTAVFFLPSSLKLILSGLLKIPAALPKENGASLEARKLKMQAAVFSALSETDWNSR